MLNVKIIADSTCDLSATLLKKYDVDIVPLYVICGDNSYKDSLEISPDQVQRYFDETGKTPTTAACSMADCYDAFSRYRGQGRDIVFISISSEMSSSLRNAQLAADELPDMRIYTVDSRNLSGGIGVCVVRAAELAQEGVSGEKIAEEIEVMVPRVRASFMINTLEFLRCGGRCSSIAALGANLLKLKPVIMVSEGKMTTGVKFRGDLISCSQKYIDYVFDNMRDPDLRRLFFVHTGRNERQLDAMREVIYKRSRFAELLDLDAGCVIYSHCGAEVGGLLYAERPEKE